jgi:hypothetical protein
MSDISLHFTWLDLALAAPIVGWPGLLVGGALGALAWRKRWYFGALLGAIVGCVAWALALVLL